MRLIVENGAKKSERVTRLWAGRPLALVVPWKISASDVEPGVSWFAREGLGWS